MTRPTARVLALLEILQQGGIHPVNDLAARLSVDERTARRYVSHLIDLEIPVESVRGRYGGYRLASGYRMPPLMLTDEEALAVLLGLIAGRRVGLVTTSAAAIQGATAKLRRVLPRQLAGRLDALMETITFTGPAQAVISPETQVMLQLAEAARDHRAVKIGYTDRQEHRTERVVHPYGIIAHHNRWYLTGLDSASNQVRSFRLDRITRLTQREDTFDMPADFDPPTHLLADLASSPWQHEVSLRVCGIASDVACRLPTGLASIEVIDEQWVRVRLRAERLDWVPGVLAGIGLPMVIEEPDELKDAVRKLAAALLTAVTHTGLVDRPVDFVGSVRRV